MTGRPSGRSRRSSIAWRNTMASGIASRKLRTPYLWSFSSLESKGRYVADGVFDPNAVSNQCGAATMLKALIP